MTEALKAELAGRIAAKQVLVVVGTGVSLASTGGQGLASWKGLISDGIEECARRGLREDEWLGQQKKLLEGDLDDLLGVAEQVSRRLGWKPTEPCDGNWNAWLRKTVGELRASQPEVIRAIRDLGAPIATLNYDNLLTEVTGRRPITWQRAQRWLPVLRGEDDAILHLHGHWGHPSSVVLGIRSYDAVMSGSLAQDLQRALASLQSLVFIGCSGTLEDPNFSALLAWMRQQLSGAEHSHYLLLRDGESLPIEVSLLREARLVQLHYGPSHADLEPFIRGIAPDASGRRRAGVNSAAGRPEPPKAVDPVRPAVHADDDMGPTLFGISAEHLADRIAEFWEELRILRRDRAVEREDLAPSKPRGAPGMPSTGHTFNIGNLSGGLAVGGGEGSVAQSGICHTAHVENRLGADLEPILAQLGETIRTLTNDQTRTALEAHLKCASDEAKGPKPDAGSINNAVKKIELGARGATAAATIADLCKRAYDKIGPYLS